MTGGRLKDGTVQYAALGQTDANGRQLFLTAPYGSYDSFLDSNYATKEQGETLRDLSGKYKAYNLVNNLFLWILQKENVTGGRKI